MGEQYEEHATEKTHAASALWGLGLTTISVRRGTGTRYSNDSCSSDSPPCHAVRMHGSAPA